MRLMTFTVAVFVAMFNYDSFAYAHPEDINGDYEVIIEVKTKVTLERAEELAGESTACFQRAFSKKVTAYAAVEGMNPHMARENNRFICTVSDPLGLFKVVNYLKRTARNHSEDRLNYEFANKVKTWFEKNEKEELKTEHDKDANVFKVATPLRANNNCKVCHIKFSNGQLVGVMVYNLAIKDEI